MGIFIIIAAIIVISVFLLIKNKRLRIAILGSLGISILSFFVSVIFTFSAQRVILWTILGIFYVSVIAFFIFWNINKSKKVYIILGIPFICTMIAIGIFLYQDFIENFSTVEEKDYHYTYLPFEKNGLLAELDDESNLEIVDNLPFLDGATALFPVYASFVQAVYSESEYKNVEGLVSCTKTDRAYNNLLNSNADIIFCAAPSKLQLKQFSDNGLDLKLVPIGREAFVFFVNNRNPVNNLKVSDIQRIYSGEIKNWKKLNGPDKSIRAFQRPLNSGSQTMLEKIMDNNPIMKPGRENVSTGMGGIINQVAVYRNFSNSIGYSFFYFTMKMVKNGEIKLLSIDGVTPSKNTIQDGSYPFSDNFYAIYVDKENKNENIERFIDWILSDQGQILIAKTGYIPIKP